MAEISPINAQSVELSNGTLITANSNAPLEVTKLVLIRMACWSQQVVGDGNAGNITIHSGSTCRHENSSMTTEATQASGGQIEITAPEMVQLINSKISTSVAGVCKGHCRRQYHDRPAVRGSAEQSDYCPGLCRSGWGYQYHRKCVSSRTRQPRRRIVPTRHQRNRQYPVAAAECRWRADGFVPGILQRGRSACPTVRGAGRGRQVQHLCGRRP